MVTFLKDTADRKAYSRDVIAATHLTAHFSGKVMDAIGPEEVRGYKDNRRAAPVRPDSTKTVTDSTIAKELWTFSAAVQHVNTEYGWSVPNPVSGRVPAPRVRKLRWLSREEAESLIQGAREGRGAAKGESPLVLSFIELGLATGMRSGEILALEWRRVDFGHRLIYFNPEDQKSGVPGSIPLNDWAVTVLRRLQAFRDRHCPRAEWVLCHADGERIQSLKKPFAYAVARAKLKKVTPHTLRHTFASWLVQAGVPLRTVCELCRHADIRTTLIYAHLAPENARKAIGEIKAPCAQNVPAVGLSLAVSGK